MACPAGLCAAFCGRLRRSAQAAAACAKALTYASLFREAEAALMERMLPFAEEAFGENAIEDAWVLFPEHQIPVLDYQSRTDIRSTMLHLSATSGR